MVATQDGDALRIAYFERYQQRHRLNAVVTSINVIAHEQVVGVRCVATNSKELDQVMELAVDVAADGDRAGNWLYVGFLGHDLSSLQPTSQVSAILAQRSR